MEDELKTLQDKYTAAHKAAVENREWDSGLIPEGFRIDPTYPDGRWLLSPNGFSHSRGGYRYTNPAIPARREAAWDALTAALKGVSWGWGPCTCCGDLAGVYENGTQVACSAGCT